MTESKGDSFSISYRFEGGEEEEDDDDDDGEEEEGSDEEDSDAGDNYSDLATSDEEGQDDDDTKAKAKAKVKAKTETPAAKKSDTDDMPFVFPGSEFFSLCCRSRAWNALFVDSTQFCRDLTRFLSVPVGFVGSLTRSFSFLPLGSFVFQKWVPVPFFFTY